MAYKELRFCPFCKKETEHIYTDCTECTSLRTRKAFERLDPLIRDHKLKSAVEALEERLWTLEKEVKRLRMNQNKK